MMADELKPCPFCGGEARLYSVSFPLLADCDDVHVSCSDCDAIGPSALYDQDEHVEGDLPSLEAEAIGFWNTRPSTPPAVSDEASAEVLDILDRHSMRVCSGKGDFNLKDEILALIHRREQMAAEAMRERCAAYVEGAGGVIPGAAVFAGLVSGNNQPCMSGDMRDRINPHTRRRFDDATRDLATAIRSLTTEIGEGKGAQ